MADVLTEDVFSATDTIKAGTRVEVVLRPHGSGEYVDVITPRCTIKMVALRKLRRPENTGAS